MWEVQTGKWHVEACCSPKIMVFVEEAGAFQWEYVCPGKQYACSWRMGHVEGYTTAKNEDDITCFGTIILGLCDLMAGVAWVQISAENC